MIRRVKDIGPKIAPSSRGSLSVGFDAVKIRRAMIWTSVLLGALACGKVTRSDDLHVLAPQPDFPSIDDHIDDRKDPTSGSGGAHLGAGGSSAVGSGGSASGAGGSAQTAAGGSDDVGGMGGMGGEQWGGANSF